MGERLRRRLGWLSLVAALGGCTTTTARHLQPAVATPGTIGFGVDSVTTASLGRTEVNDFTASAAAVAPTVSPVQRDVVWRITETGRLELCRPRKDGTHACQPVPDAGSHGVIVDPGNRGRINSSVTQAAYGGGTTTWVTVTAQLRSTQGIPLSPHYGIWVSGYGLLGFKLCRVRLNQPECVDVKRGANAAPLIGRAEAVAVLRDGPAMWDVLWVQTPDRRLVRCQAGGDGEPACADARILE